MYNKKRSIRFKFLYTRLKLLAGLDKVFVHVLNERNLYLYSGMSILDINNKIKHVDKKNNFKTLTMSIRRFFTNGLNSDLTGRGGDGPGETFRLKFMLLSHTFKRVYEI